MFHVTVHTVKIPSFILLAAKIAVVKLEGSPYLCKSDEVGELCISSGATGSAYWGLAGKTNYTFKVSHAYLISSINPWPTLEQSCKGVDALVSNSHVHVLYCLVTHSQVCGPKQQRI